MDNVAILRASPNKKEHLQNASYHDLDNVFSEIWFSAGNPHDIHCATPSKVLHMIQKGWHNYALDGFFRLLTDGPIRFLEALAKRMSDQLHHQSDHDLPRTKLTHGISTMRQLVYSYYFSCCPCTVALDGTNMEATINTPS
jgi:hypothetical protein